MHYRFLVTSAKCARILFSSLDSSFCVCVCGSLADSRYMTVFWLPNGLDLDHPVCFMLFRQRSFFVGESPISQHSEIFFLSSSKLLAEAFSACEKNALLASQILFFTPNSDYPSPDLR